MLGKTLKRAGLGLLLGMAIGNLISYCVSGGRMLDPAVIQRFGTWQNGVMVQTLLVGIVGAVSFAGISLYESDRWPLLAVTAAHFLLIMAAYVPTALFLGWFDSLAEALVIVSILAAVHLTIFLILWFRCRAQVKEANKLIAEREKTPKDEKTGGAL